MLESKDKSWIHHQIMQQDGYFQYPSPLPPATTLSSSLPSSSSSSPSSGSRISPALLFIIVILAVLFFISGLLHLLVRFLIKRPSSSSSSSPQSNIYPEISTSDALQTQLQQLFHLHDSGLDQAFIDALPVFYYKEIVGLKELFDCAVCLCEFSDKDKLRLLPVCSHAFHINCIDTWLLSNSTCPLCRGTLFNPEFSMENPTFEFDEMREDEGYFPGPKTMGMEEIVVDKGVLPVRLGKFKRLNDHPPGESVGETSSSNLDARRCFSMGSFQYVLGDSDLRVPLSNDRRRGCNFKLSKGLEHKGNSLVEGKKIGSVSKGESFSVSKIWLWSKNDKLPTSSSDEQIGMPSSLSTDLPPWLVKTQENEM